MFGLPRPCRRGSWIAQLAPDFDQGLAKQVLALPKRRVEYLRVVGAQPDPPDAIARARFDEFAVAGVRQLAAQLVRWSEPGRLSRTTMSNRWTNHVPATKPRTA